MLSLKRGLSSAEGAGRFPDGLVSVDRNRVRGRVNCWSMSSLYEENLSEGDELMEGSLGWKFCYRDLLKLGQYSRELPMRIRPGLARGWTFIP